MGEPFELIFAVNFENRLAEMEEFKQLIKVNSNSSQIIIDRFTEKEFRGKKILFCRLDSRYGHKLNTELMSQIHQYQNTLYNKSIETLCIYVNRFRLNSDYLSHMYDDPENAVLRNVCNIQKAVTIKV